MLKQTILVFQEAGVDPDIKVMGSLVRSSGIKFKYKRILLEEMEEAGLMPDNKILKTIEFQLKKAREIILKMVGTYFIMYYNNAKFKYWNDDNKNNSFSLTDEIVT